MQRITAELSKAENTNFPTHREGSLPNGSMLTSTKESLMKYRKSFNKGIGDMRKSDCILNDVCNSNAFMDLENKANASDSKMTKKSHKKKGGSESPMKTSVKQQEGKEVEIFRRSSSQHQIITNDKDSSRKKNSRSQFEQKLERHAQQNFLSTQEDNNINFS